nr:unnamed protein product [Callosobruchus analis]
MILSRTMRSVVETTSARITQLEEKVEEIIVDNSTVVRELKDETKMLKAENEFLLQKYDDLQQQAKIYNLRIYKINETPNENLPQVIIQLFQTHLRIKVGTEDMVTRTKIGKKRRTIVLEAFSSNFLVPV